MKHFPGIGFKLVSTTLLLLLLAPASATEEQQTRQSLKLVDEVIVPAYQSLVESTGSLAASASSFCENPDKRGLDALQQQFQSTVDSWQSVQWLRKGPAEFSFRHRRLALWPDKHNTGPRQVRNLLRQQDPSALEANSFAAGSVAIQGIPALERLLFASEALDKFTNPDNTYRCRYLVTITANLHRIATALDNDWTTFYRDAMATPGGDNSFFELPKGVTSEFMSQLVTQLQFILEQKLERPLGIDPSIADNPITPEALDPRPRRAENWRSQRALKNIRINLTVLNQVYAIALEPLIPTPATARQIGSAFADAEQKFGVLPDQLEKALSTDPGALLAAYTALDQLYQLAEKTLPAALDIPLGFNGLDGD